MKKLLCICLAAVMLFALCGCTPAEQGSDKLQVVCTLFPQYEFARAVAGDRAEVTMLLSPGTDSHSYDPTPGDLLRVAGSDMFIYVSPYMETWAQSMAQNADDSGVRVLRLDSEVTLLHDEHHDHGDELHGGYNGHIWTDPIIAAEMVRKIATELAALDPEGEQLYAANAEKYVSKLMSLDERLQQLAENRKHSAALFAGKFAFGYMFERYGLEYISAYSSCSADGEPEAAEMARIIDRIKRDGVPCVYYEELAEPRVARTIAAETGCDMLLLHSCHNLSRDEFEGGATYIGLMDQNVTNLEKGLL